MFTAIHGKSTKVYADQYDVSQYLNKADSPRPMDCPETTTFGKNDKCYIPGIADSTLTMEGFYDGNVGAIDEIFSRTFGKSIATGTNFSWYYNGDTAGNSGFGAKMIHKDYQLTSTKDDAVKISAGGQSVVGRERLISLKSAVNAFSETGLTYTAPVDLGSAGNSGGSGYLHITALNSGTITNLTIQHASSQGDSYSDIVTFTAPSAATRRTKAARCITRAAVR